MFWFKWGFFSGKDDNNCFGSKKENTGIVKTIKQFINWLRQDQLQKKTDFYFKNPWFWLFCIDLLCILKILINVNLYSYRIRSIFSYDPLVNLAKKKPQNTDHFKWNINVLLNGWRRMLYCNKISHFTKI